MLRENDEELMSVLVTRHLELHMLFYPSGSKL